MFRRSFVARLLAAIILLSILTGAGFMAYRAGEARGYALGVSTTQQLAPGETQNGQNPAVPAPYGYPGYFYGYRPHMPFFFPFGFLFFPFMLLFFFFVVGGLIRFMIVGAFFRGRWGHHHGPWGGPGPWGQPGSAQPQGPAPEQPAKPAE